MSLQSMNRKIIFSILIFPGGGQTAQSTFDLIDSFDRQKESRIKWVHDERIYYQLFNKKIIIDMDKPEFRFQL